MAQSLQDGNVFQYTTTGAVSNGQLLVINRMAGVALDAATGAGKKISLALTGVFSVAAVARVSRRKACGRCIAAPVLK